MSRIKRYNLSNCGYDEAKQASDELDNACNALAESWENNTDDPPGIWNDIDRILPRLSRPDINIFETKK